MSDNCIKNIWWWGSINFKISNLQKIKLKIRKRSVVVGPNKSNEKREIEWCGGGRERNAQKNKKKITPKP